jgi:hypothetical protein
MGYARQAARRIFGDTLREALLFIGQDLFAQL